MTPIPCQRPLFDIPEEIAYFNTSYNAAQLKETTLRLVESAQAKGRPWQRKPDDFFADAETLRTLAAGLFGGSPDCWAIVPAASYGLSAAARAVAPDIAAGDKVVVIDEAFPSNYLPWQRLAEARGATLVTVPTPDDHDWTAAVLAAVEPATKLLAIPPCHWTNGARIDLEPVAAAARDVDAILAVDATQWLGATPLPLDRIQPDFLVAAGYKWLLCPYGVSLLYVAPRWHGAQALEESWITRANAADFANLVNYSEDYRAGARRFDVGQTCTALLPGAIAALEQLGDWGLAEISASLAAINARIAAQVSKLGFDLPSEDNRSPHLIGIGLPEGLDRPLVKQLATRGIHVSQRGRSLRISPHLHVSDADVERLLSALSRLI